MSPNFCFAAVLLSGSCFQATTEATCDAACGESGGGSGGGLGSGGGGGESGSCGLPESAAACPYTAPFIVEQSMGTVPGRQTGACSDPDGPTLSFATTQEAKTLMTGRWAYCGGPKLLGSQASDGFEVTAGGLVFALKKDALGQLVRMAPNVAESAGEVCVMRQQGASYSQTNLSWFDGGVAFLKPAFLHGPLKWRPFANEKLVYVAVPSPCEDGGTTGTFDAGSRSEAFCPYPSGVERSTVTDPNRKTGACADPVGPARPWTTPAEAKMLLTGRWAQCSGAQLGEAASDGLEITAAGFLFALKKDSSGQFARMRGWGSTADVCVVTSGATQVNISWPGGTLPFVPTFSDSPLRVDISGRGYVAVP